MNTSHRDTIKAQIAQSQAQAAWLTAYAHTPANLNRDVRQGISGVMFSKDQLVDDAMQRARSHLVNAQKLIDILNTLS